MHNPHEITSNSCITLPNRSFTIMPASVSPSGALKLLTSATAAATRPRRLTVTIGLLICLGRTISISSATIPVTITIRIGRMDGQSTEGNGNAWLYMRLLCGCPSDEGLQQAIVAAEKNIGFGIGGS